jgi:hypothetical protein
VGQYNDGVWLAELMAQTVASALRGREEPNRPLTATLADYLCAHMLQLVMDNGEHLLSVCAGLAEAIRRPGR